MKEKWLKGCGTALATPFLEDAPDYEAYRNLVARQLAAGVDFLVPLGSTAETPCLRDTEKRELLRITRECCPDRPVVAGVGTNSLDATLRNMEWLDPLGPDAWLVVTPYYNKPTQEGMFAYFKAVAAATPRAVVLYNVPGRTGINLLPETVLRLAQIPNIVAVKEASGNIAQIQEIIDGAPEGFSVLSGNDDQTWPLMALGADGVISVASNVAPGPVSELVQAAARGDMSRARALHRALTPLFKACFVESNPIPVKAALSVLGLCAPRMRSPLSAPVPDTVALMRRTLAALFPDVKTD